MHILIAEDHPDLRKILTLYLQKDVYKRQIFNQCYEADIIFSSYLKTGNSRDFRLVHS